MNCVWVIYCKSIIHCGFSCVVSCFALYILYSCRTCVLVLGVGCCWSFLFSFSVFVLVSGVVMFFGMGYILWWLESIACC